MASTHNEQSNSNWRIDSWRDFAIAQQVDWQEPIKLSKARKYLSQEPPLVVCGEVDSLKSRIAQVQNGKAFILQGGDCAEMFDSFNPDDIKGRLKVFLQMAAILTYGMGKPVVKVMRIAGQFGKPRSQLLEKVDGAMLPSYRGDMINGIMATEESRKPDPWRLVRAYQHSVTTLNLLRGFARGGFSSLSRVHNWNRDFIKQSACGQAFEGIARDIDQALSFVGACGLNVENQPEFQSVDLFTSHEALVLDYEEQLVRADCSDSGYYLGSTHFPWIGDRTRQVDGAHIEFLRGVKNPIAIKIGPNCNREQLEFYLKTLNPENEAGRLTLITRLGRSAISSKLPELIQVVKESKIGVTWVCDPMHGNTYSHSVGMKTRNFEDICEELVHFFRIHHESGTYPGGVHFEMTHENVTECLGGESNVLPINLRRNYTSSCDPRLNGSQSLEVAFLLADILMKIDDYRQRVGSLPS